MSWQLCLRAILLATLCSLPAIRLPYSQRFERPPRGSLPYSPPVGALTPDVGLDKERFGRFSTIASCVLSLSAQYPGSSLLYIGRTLILTQIEICCAVCCILHFPDFIYPMSRQMLITSSLKNQERTRGQTPTPTSRNTPFSFIPLATGVGQPHRLWSIWWPRGDRGEREALESDFWLSLSFSLPSHNRKKESRENWTFREAFRMNQRSSSIATSPPETAVCVTGVGPIFMNARGQESARVCLHLLPPSLSSVARVLQGATCIQQVLSVSKCDMYNICVVALTRSPPTLYLPSSKF